MAPMEQVLQKLKNRYRLAISAAAGLSTNLDSHKTRIARCSQRSLFAYMFARCICLAESICTRPLLSVNLHYFAVFLFLWEVFPPEGTWVPLLAGDAPTFFFGFCFKPLLFGEEPYRDPSVLSSWGRERFVKSCTNFSSSTFCSFALLSNSIFVY